MSNDSTCRDFERGVCTRGDKCKYFHPDNVEKDGKLPICKDFQNRGCDRFKCKFLHVTVDEEAEYNKTGVLPEHGGRPALPSINALFPGKAVCKDFLNGRCDRGNRCRFQHVSEDHSNGPPMPHGQQLSMYGKRRRDGFDLMPPPGGNDSPVLMEENEMLTRKITDLQRQVMELRTMNDTLYDQNTRYRNQLRGITAPGETPSVSNPYSQSVYAAQPVLSSIPAASAAVTGYNFAQY